MNKLLPYNYVMDRTASSMDIQASYGQALDVLQSTCIADKNVVHPRFTKSNGSEIYRPTSFKEIIELELNDFETQYDVADGHKRSIDERLTLFKLSHNSCTAIVNKKKSTEFMIIPISKQLIELKKDFNHPLINVNYETLKKSVDGVVLDSSKGQYNMDVDKDVSIGLWSPLLDGDNVLSKEHADVVYTHFKNGRGFYVYKNTVQDEFRALYVRPVGYRFDSFDVDPFSLDGEVRFLIITPQKEISRKTQVKS